MLRGHDWRICIPSLGSRFSHSRRRICRLANQCPWSFRGFMRMCYRATIVSWIPTRASIHRSQPHPSPSGGKSLAMAAHRFSELSLTLLAMLSCTKSVRRSGVGINGTSNDSKSILMVNEFRRLISRSGSIETPIGALDPRNENSSINYSRSFRFPIRSKIGFLMSRSPMLPKIG